ncbi:MAG: CBS domain-containing protein [Gammaproteobacteria bacterium]|nr:CBS domain-containing protein [Gammaproteobacteria bacterium]
MNVETLMSKQVTACSPGDSLEQVANVMWARDCGCLPVCTSVDGGAARPVGMITDRDICMCGMFQHKPLGELHVADAMSKRIVSCSPADPVDRAETLMREAQIRRLPVLDETGALVGMITLADIAREAARERMRTAQDVTANEVGDTLAAICEPSAPALAA